MAELEKKLTYEECRLKRIEENKKRWQELKLTMLAEDVHNATNPKPSPVCLSFSLSFMLVVYVNAP